MQLARIAAFLVVMITVSGCASPPAYRPVPSTSLREELAYGPPAAPTPMSTAEDVTTAAVVVGGIGIVGGTVACATECPAPYDVAVPVVIGVGALVAAGYVLYTVGMARGLR